MQFPMILVARQVKPSIEPLHNPFLVHQEIFAHNRLDDVALVPSTIDAEFLIGTARAKTANATSADPARVQDLLGSPVESANRLIVQGGTFKKQCTDG